MTTSSIVSVTRRSRMRTETERCPHLSEKSHRTEWCKGALSWWVNVVQRSKTADRNFPCFSRGEAGDSREQLKAKGASDERGCIDDKSHRRNCCYHPGKRKAHVFRRRNGRRANREPARIGWRSKHPSCDRDRRHSGVF